MKCIQMTAAMAGQNRYGVRFDLLDVKRQMQTLITELGSTHLSRDKRVGYKTTKARAYVAHSVIELLRQSGYKIKNIRNLDQRHIKVVVDRWLSSGLAASTLQTRFSILRWLAASIGKAGLVRDPSFYGVPDQAIARSYVAREDKSWTSKGVDPRTIIEAAAEQDEWVSTVLELQHSFGLRLAEAILFRPRVARVGNVLRIEDGTKGGRTRLVPIQAQSQEQAFERALELSKRSARGNLVPPGKSVQQAKDRVYYVAGKKLGITKSRLGVVPHGLRHQYCNDRYEELAGEPTQVRGGGPVSRILDEAARSLVSNELGHSRIGVTASYTGPRPKGRPAPTANDRSPAVATEFPLLDEQEAP